jgi:hypothetical protein
MKTVVMMLTTIRMKTIVTSMTKMTTMEQAVAVAAGREIPAAVALRRWTGMK